MPNRDDLLKRAKELGVPTRTLLIFSLITLLALGIQITGCNRIATRAIGIDISLGTIFPIWGCHPRKRRLGHV